MCDVRYMNIYEHGWEGMGKENYGAWRGMEGHLGYGKIERDFHCIWLDSLVTKVIHQIGSQLENAYYSDVPFDSMPHSLLTFPIQAHIQLS